MGKVYRGSTTSVYRSETVSRVKKLYTGRNLLKCKAAHKQFSYTQLAQNNAPRHQSQREKLFNPATGQDHKSKTLHSLKYSHCKIHRFVQMKSDIITLFTACVLFASLVKIGCFSLNNTTTEKVPKPCSVLQIHHKVAQSFAGLAAISEQQVPKIHLACH